MNDPARVEQIARMELDIDLRLIDLWREVDAVVEWDTHTLGAYLRAAYGLGYVHALTEPDPGHLATDNGYRLTRRAA